MLPQQLEQDVTVHIGFGKMPCPPSFAGFHTFSKIWNSRFFSKNLDLRFFPKTKRFFSKNLKVLFQKPDGSFPKTEFIFLKTFQPLVCNQNCSLQAHVASQKLQRLTCMHGAFSTSSTHQKDTPQKIKDQINKKIKNKINIFLIFCD